MRVEAQDYMGPPWAQSAPYDSPGELFEDYLEGGAAQADGGAKMFGAEGLFGRAVAEPAAQAPVASTASAARSDAPLPDSSPLPSRLLSQDASPIQTTWSTAPDLDGEDAVSVKDASHDLDGGFAPGGSLPTPGAVGEDANIASPVVTAGQFLAALMANERQARRPLPAPTPSPSPRASQLNATMSGDQDVELVIGDGELAAGDHACALAAATDVLAEHGKGLARLIINGVVVAPRS